MKLLNIGIAVCVFALIAGIAAPVEAGAPSTCRREASGVQACWDFQTEESCAGLGGIYQDDSFCSDFGSFDGACVSTEECCLVREVAQVEGDPGEACEGPFEGEWFEGETCESVPVELQIFDVEKK